MKKPGHPVSAGSKGAWFPTDSFLTAGGLKNQTVLGLAPFVGDTTSPLASPAWGHGWRTGMNAIKASPRMGNFAPPLPRFEGFGSGLNSGKA